MITHRIFKDARLARVAAGALAFAMAATAVTATPASAQVSTQRATESLTLSIGEARIINMPVAISDVVVSNDAVIAVQVKSPRQIVIFGKAAGSEGTVYATSKDGRIVYAAKVTVGQNVNSVQDMLGTAMPDANIKVAYVNGLVLLTGTVSAPEDAAQAEELVNAFMGDDVKAKHAVVVNRLRTATPLQVNLQVRIAEVSRDVSKTIGLNLLNGGNFQGTGFFFSQGRAPGTITPGVVNPQTGIISPTQYQINPAGKGTSLTLASRFLGLDMLAALDLAENDGLVTTLAQPNLTSLSGETASFLAGGEIPIPISQSLGQVSVEYKQYGVSLAFTPTVLADGRISMRVRPEVSELTSAGSVQLNGFTVPGLTTRRAETTIELGSGQSFMIGGLLRSSSNNSVDKTPFLGDLPILGALFRSNNFRKAESELVIVVTPYLVKPVSANQIALPTDGYRAPNDVQRLLTSKAYDGDTGADRPKPSMGGPRTIPTPGLGETSSADKPRKGKSRKDDVALATPGFGN